VQSGADELKLAWLSVDAALAHCNLQFRNEFVEGFYRRERGVPNVLHRNRVRGRSSRVGTCTGYRTGSFDVSNLQYNGDIRRNLVPDIADIIWVGLIYSLWSQALKNLQKR
jgi:hypothetical protein